MMRNTLPAAFAAGFLLIVPAVAAAAAMTLRSVEVKLPTGERPLPDGPGVATVTNNCLGCHSSGMILNQPVMPKAAWQAEVAKMRNVYKAPVAETDVAAIVDYLVAVKGAK